MGLSAATLFARLLALHLFAALLVQAAHAQTNYRVEKYNTLNGLTKDHWVNGIELDGEGMVWLALNKGGLARFDGDVFTFYPLPGDWEKDFGESAIQGLKIDSEGKFWVMGLDKILFFDPATGRFSMPPEVGGVVNQGVTAIHKTRNGSIAFFSKGKLYFRRQGETAFKVAGNAQAIQNSPWLSDVEEDDRGELWALALSGYYHFQAGQEAPEFFGFEKTPGNPFPQARQPMHRFYDSPPGCLWYSDVPGKAIKLDAGGAIVETYQMREFEYLYSVAEAGDLRWFGTFDGLLKVTHRSRRFQTWLDLPFDMSEGAPTGKSCYGIAEGSDGSIFTTIPDGNLQEIAPGEPGSVRSIPPSLKDIRRYGMMTDRQGRIWFSRQDDSVVDVFDPATGALRRIAYPRTSSLSNSLMQEQPGGTVWVACMGGIVLLDPATGQATPFDLPEKDFVWHLHQSDGGMVWAATKNGILKISSLPPTPSKGGGDITPPPPLEGVGGRHVTRFNPANTPGMKPGEILSIHEAGGFLWLGSTGGLVRFDPKNGKAATFTAAKGGLPNDYVYAAIPAEGFLWLPTNKGLARVSLASATRENSEFLDVATFGTDDGLPHHEFNTLTFLKAKNGKIWLGGLNGIACFDPKDLLPQPSENHSLLIAEFSKYDQQADSVLNFSFFANSLAEPFTLRPQERFFTARFTLLDYRNPKANQYSYRLEGFDPDWVFAGNQNTLRYANLPPGKYTLRIRGANSSGAWSSREATAVIVVQQAWYKTRWAWLAYALLAAGLGWLAYRQRLRQIRLAHELELEHARSKDLQELEEFKSRFFTNITHEFRTPLTVVLGNLEIEKLEIEKLGKQPDPKISQFLNFLISKNALTRRNAESLLRLINQILDLAKLESNALKINYVQGDVLPYLRYISESLHSLANARNVMLRVESKEAEIVMDYDPERLLSVVHNLLSNAIKFTPSGGRVTLRAGLLNLEGLVNLDLQVSDTGVGIPSEDLPKIFDRFYQVESLRANSTAGGSGIGLSLTKELVKAMGGEISVESEMSKGTTFTVRLPVVQSPLTPPPDPLKGEPYPANSAEFLKGKITSELPDLGSPFRGSGGGVRGLSHEGNPSILLIEDNPDVVEYLAACLGENYQLDFAYNGRAGIEKALETVPDLILSDVMMPEQDGFEVCDFLKNDERTSHIPIVLLTAKADVESRIAGLKRGADAYLAKPFHQEELMVTLANLLELRRKLQTKYRAIATESPITNRQSPITDPENEFLKKLRASVEAHLSDSGFSVEELCRAVGMSYPVIHRKLAALIGRSPALFIRSIRLQRAKVLLKTTSDTVSEIAYETGFNDPKFFSRVFSEEFGVPPSEARRG